MSTEESLSNSHEQEHDLLEKRNAIIDAVEETKQRIRMDFAVPPDHFAQLVTRAFEATGKGTLSKEQVDAMTAFIGEAGSDQQTISGEEVADRIFNS